MRTDLRNGAIIPSDESSRAEVDALMAKLGAALDASRVHPTVSTRHLLLAYLELWVIAGHDDIANAFSKMLNNKLEWPADRRAPEEAEADDKKVSSILEDVIGMRNLSSDPKKIQVAMSAVANLSIGSIGRFNAEAAAYLKEKMLTAANWSIYKIMPPAQGGLN